MSFNSEKHFGTPKRAWWCLLAVYIATTMLLAAIVTVFFRWLMR